MFNIREEVVSVDPTGAVFECQMSENQRFANRQKLVRSALLVSDSGAPPQIANSKTLDKEASI